MTSSVRVDIEDVRVEILMRLPAKSICRFRCVCKSWNSLLLSSLFITLHHKFTISNTPSNQKSYLVMDTDSYKKDLACVVLHRPPQCLDLPITFSLIDRGYKVVGVINGVVCIASLKFSIILWNPTIKKHISYRHYSQDCHFSIGFGFDVAKNAFKVVVISRKGTWYYLLSLEDGCWKKKSLPSNIYRLSLSPSYFINQTQTIYWPAKQEDGTSMLVLFDCEREEFKTMELPRELAAKDQDMRFFKHYEMLSVQRITKKRPVWEMEVWVMMEQESLGMCCSQWKRLFTVHDSLSGLPGIADAVFIGDSHRLPIGPGGFYQPLLTQVFDQTLFLMDVTLSGPTPLPKPSGRLIF